MEHSPDAQMRSLKDYAAKNKIVIQEEHIYIDEGVSAKTTNRPEFQRMIKKAKANPTPFKVILVHKFDRFARNREDSVVFKSLLRRECGIRVVSITEQLEDDKFSVILEAMLEAMAEYYSLNLADEVKKGMTEKARKGGFLTRPPYGYRIDEEGKSPVIVPDKAEKVRIIYKRFLEGNSLYSVMKYMNTLDGDYVFTTIRVKYILNNPMYCGLIRWNMRDSNNKYKVKDQEEWIITEGQHEPIVSKEIFNKAQDRLIRIKPKIKPAEVTTSLFSGIVRCSNCGSVLTKRERKYPSGTIKTWFQCNGYNKSNCNVSHGIRGEVIKDSVLEQLIILAESENLAEIDIAQNTTTPNNTELGYLQRQLSNLETKLKRVKSAYADGVDSLEEYKENKARILKEQEEIKKAIEIFNSESNSSDKLQRKAKELYQLLIEDDIPLLDQQKALRTVISQITYDKINEQLVIEYWG